MSTVDFTDIQGLLRFGYGAMTCASYELLRIRDLAAARAWLLSAPVTNAANADPPPDTALNVAFTASGLAAMGLPESVIADFSHEFRSGMAVESRSRQLGDVDANSPANWHWGAPGREPHLLVMFFGKAPAYETFVRETQSPEWRNAFDRLTRLETSDFGGVEPFGFRDGVSQPEIDWQQKRKTPRTQREFSNVVSVGEFVLGYRNEYGKYSTRPLLAPSSANAHLPAAEDEPEKKDLGRNGTYLVMRQLQQDVRTFWKFLQQESDGSSVEAEKLAASMVGRTQNGDPLEQIQKAKIPGITGKSETQNRFTYDQDPTGTRCPFGAHVRRANPRNTDFPKRPKNLLSQLITMLGFGPGGFRDDLISSVRFHRIARRGREYGVRLTLEQALAPAATNVSDPESGLHFICLNADICRQFEFIQNAWIESSKFSALTGESDPLLGLRSGLPGCPIADHFTIQKSGGLRRRLTKVPQFIKVRGGAYFFMPGIAALRYVAHGDPSQ
ncbi:MAG: peroxidase [Verrucomicrobia bacterium]|nr:peroxidase [Verrucomicrobiota bacterium]